MFQNVILGWIARRALELGGIVGAALTAWNNLPPATQDAVLSILGRNWQSITLGALVPIAVSLWGYVWSAVSTFRPQVVTADRQQIKLQPDSTAQAKVEVIAKSAAAPRTLWDRLTSR